MTLRGLLGTINQNQRESERWIMRASYWLRVSISSSLKRTCSVLSRPLMLFTVAAALGGTRPAAASVITTLLGGASNYAVLGIGGSSVAVESDFEVYQSATVINGNVGVGPFSVWTHAIDCTIGGVKQNQKCTATFIKAHQVACDRENRVGLAPHVDCHAQARDSSFLKVHMVPSRCLEQARGSARLSRGGLRVMAARSRSWH